MKQIEVINSSEYPSPFSSQSAALISSEHSDLKKETDQMKDDPSHKEKYGSSLLGPFWDGFTLQGNFCIDFAPVT